MHVAGELINHYGENYLKNPKPIVQPASYVIWLDEKGKK